jgi:hypothetical protein
LGSPGWWLVSGLRWVEHRYSGHTADVAEGHYLVQADPSYRLGVAEMRWVARLVRRRRPLVMLGYFDTPEAAKRACEINDRWCEDIEAGAIG